MHVSMHIVVPIADLLTCIGFCYLFNYQYSNSQKKFDREQNESETQDISDSVGTEELLVILKKPKTGEID